MRVALPFPPPIPVDSPALWGQVGLLNAILLALSYLSQRNGTRAVRFALMPVVYALIARMSGGIKFEDPVLSWLNYVFGLGGCYLILLLPRFLLAEPYMHSNPALVGSTTIDLLINPALILWSPTPYYAPPPPPKNTTYLTASGHARVWARDNAIMASVCLLCVFFPGLLDISGTDGLTLGLRDEERIPFLPDSIQPLPEWFIELWITAFFGTCVYLFVEIMWHGVAAALIGFGGWDCTAFPEMFDRPWLASSVHEFWGQRWHPMFAPTFAFYSQAFPKALQGPVIFLLSGLIHDFGLIPLAPEIHPTCITAFFAIQALPIAVEKAFSAVAPPYKQGGGGRRRVGGVWGRLWTAAWVLGTGRWIVEGWMRMGLVGMAVRTVYRFVPDLSS